MTKYSFLPHFRLITFFFLHDFLPSCFPELLTGVFRIYSLWKVKMDWFQDSCRCWDFIWHFAGTYYLHTLGFSENWSTIFLQNDTVSSQMIVLIHHHENLNSCKFKLCTATDFVPSTLIIICIHVWLYSCELVEGENVLFKYSLQTVVQVHFLKALEITTL
jgi:hypothetical protein